jgi:fructan beta-fructosidase
MAVVFPHEHIIQFYDSQNLIQWRHISDFGPAGDVKEIWECPSLAEVPVEGMPGKKKWVLLNSQQTTMQYFVGEFDGTRFRNENPPAEIYRPDYGSDFYAGVTYNQLPQDQLPVLVGWANNWTYANDIPTDPWKSMMGLPRGLSLKKSGNRWILLQAPPAALSSLRDHHWAARSIRVEKQKLLPLHSMQGEIQLEWIPAANARSGLTLAMGHGQSLRIGYDAKKEKLYFDRQFAGDTLFNAEFAKLTKYEVTLHSVNRKLKLQVFIDHSLVEIFANDGELVMTTQIFPDPANDGMALFSEGAACTFSKMEFWQIRSAW